MRLEKNKTRGMSSVFCFLIVSLVFSSENENYPEALKVSGLVGMNARMNGVYYHGPDSKFGQPFYQKKETEDETSWTIIRNSGIDHESARWLLMYDLQNPNRRNIFALLKSDHLLQNSEAWYVKDLEERWEENHDLKLSKWDGKLEFAKMLKKIKCPKALKLCLADGIPWPMNGVYYLGDSLHCERIFYQKEKTEEDHCTIRWHPGGKWILNCDGLLPDDKFNADLQDDVLLPLLSEEKWRVHNNGKFYNNLQISEWKGTLRELLAKMRAITFKDILVGLPYIAFCIMVLGLPVFTTFASSIQSAKTQEYKHFTDVLPIFISFLPILQMFYRSIYDLFFEKKMQKKFGKKANAIIGEVSFYIVYFLLEAVVIRNPYSAFLTIVTIGVATFISSMLSKLLASKTKLNGDLIWWVRIGAYMLVSNYVSNDKLDYFLFWGTNKDANSSLSNDIGAYERCTEAKNRWKSTKRINPLIEENCNQSHPCNSQFFLQGLFNHPQNSNFSENSTILSKEICSMGKVDFTLPHRERAKGSVYRKDDCKSFNKRCDLKHHPDKGGTEAKFLGCTLVNEQCKLLVDWQNSYFIKFQNILAYFWAILFPPPRQQILFLPKN